MTTTAKTPEPQNTDKKSRACRFYYSWRGCRDGEECLYKHNADAPACKYYASKWGCWNGKHCRFRHEGEKEGEVDTVKQFYNELNQWLDPNKMEDSPQPVVSYTSDALTSNDVKKTFVSRGTQTKATPDFVNCGECGEEFKSGRNLQQSLERHYIHKLASADFHHLRFFKHQSDLRRDDPFCAACGELFSSIESLLQHMGTKVSFSTTSGSVRREHQAWFKQLVQPFVYRDLEILETEEELVQRIMEVYFVNNNVKPKFPTNPPNTPVTSDTSVAKKSEKSKNVSPGKFARKLQEHVNQNKANKVCPYVHCDECGEIFDDPGGDQKLHVHYADMLARADRLHMWLLKEQGDLEAHCSACKKTFLSPIALLQHLGSKQRPAGSKRATVTSHNRLLSDIADIFVGRDLGMEGFSTESLGRKLVDIIAPEDLNRNESSNKDDIEDPLKENPDDAFHMESYFSRVSKWQAKMSYGDYVKDDQERTRNHGFTVAEVEYLQSKNLTPTSRGVFRVLNTLYKSRRNPLKSRKSISVLDKETSKQKSAKDNSETADSEKVDGEKVDGEKVDGEKVDGEKLNDGKDNGGKENELGENDTPRGKPRRKKMRQKRRGSKSDQRAEPLSDANENVSARGDSVKRTGKNEKGVKKAKSKATEKKDEEKVDVQKVVYEVRMDGTVFIREEPDTDTDEDIVSGKDDSMLEKVVEDALHKHDKSGKPRFVEQDEQKINVCIVCAKEDEKSQPKMDTVGESLAEDEETSIADLYIETQENMIAANNQDMLSKPSIVEIGPELKLDIDTKDGNVIANKGDLSEIVNGKEPGTINTEMQNQVDVKSKDKDSTIETNLGETVIAQMYMKETIDVKDELTDKKGLTISTETNESVTATSDPKKSKPSNTDATEDPLSKNNIKVTIDANEAVTDMTDKEAATDLNVKEAVSNKVDGTVSDNAKETLDVTELSDVMEAVAEMMDVAETVANITKAVTEMPVVKVKD